MLQLVTTPSSVANECQPSVPGQEFPFGRTDESLQARVCSATSVFIWVSEKLGQELQRRRDLMCWSASVKRYGGAFGDL